MEVPKYEITACFGKREKPGMMMMMMMIRTATGC
jgi:hypothetical protein